LPGNVGVQPASITEIYMAKDDGRGLAGTKATSFDQSDTVQHCVIKLNPPQPGTMIKFNWTKRPKGDNVVEDAAFVTTGLEDKVEASLSLPPEERNGKYVVAASLND